MKSRGKKQQAYAVPLAEGGRLARRQTGFLSDGSYLFQDQLRVDGFLAPTIITSTAWLLEFYHLTRGEMYCWSGTKRLEPETRKFGILYPPFSIAKPCFKNTRTKLWGLAGNHRLPDDIPNTPTLFGSNFSEVPSGVEQAIAIIRAGTQPQAVAAYPSPSLLSLKAKRLIDENYFDYPSITRIAERLGVSLEHLSRQFKHDYELTPSSYLRQLRLADVPLQLARGEEIVNISEKAGFNDLSRFYKQFRKTTRTSPGACRTVMKPRR